MSNRRHLVSRSRNDANSSPAPQAHHRVSQTPTRPHTALPPYEPPCCPLSEDAKRKVEALSLDHDYSKYKKHLKTTIAAVTTSTADLNERLTTRKDELKRANEKRKNREQAGSSQGLTEEETAARTYFNGLNKQVASLTDKADLALRDLIDYGDELAMKVTILKDVAESISTSQHARTQSGEEDEHNMLSATKSYQMAQEDYARKYKDKGLRAKYGFYGYFCAKDIY
jgi:hypothetical protein